MKLLAENRTFATTEGLNEAVSKHLYAHQFELSKTAIKLLDVVARHAVKYAGAAWLKADTLATMLDVNTKTVRRSLTKLQTLGIIEKRSTLRKVSGGYGANIIVILPADYAQTSIFDFGAQSQVSSRSKAVKPTERKAQVAKKRAEALIFINKPIQTPKTTLQPAQEAPATFYDHVRSLISDKKQRREFFAAFKKQTAGLLRFDIYADKAEQLETIAVRALYIAMKRQQNGNVDNSVGYFYGILRNQIDQALFSDISEVYSASPDDVLLASLPY